MALGTRGGPAAGSCMEDTDFAMNHPLDGVCEKLRRAEESIGNLNRGIECFLDEAPFRTIPDTDEELVQKFLDYHSSRPVPKRFSVLAGEIIHHLRSSLDHVVWQLVIANGGNPDKNKTEFPIFARKPANKNEERRYGQKLKGVSSSARKLIEHLQPYNRGTGSQDDPLLIIHDMDRIDKHKELVIIVPDPKRRVTYALFGTQGPLLTLTTKKDPKKEIPVKTSWGGEVKMGGDLTAHVSFPQLGSKENQPVIPSLMALLNAVRGAINSFQPLLE